jgi:hypothetical protein
VLHNHAAKSSAFCSFLLLVVNINSMKNISYLVNIVKDSLWFNSLASPQGINYGYVIHNK